MEVPLTTTRAISSTERMPGVDCFLISSGYTENTEDGRAED